MTFPAIIGVTPYGVRISDRTHWVFVEVTCSDGLTGTGEATLPGFDGTLFALARWASDKLSGQPAWPNVTEQLLRDVRAGRAQWAIASAVEQALWDAQGKRLGVPVSTLLGGALREQIPLYANINRGVAARTPEAFAERARKAADDGFPIIKIAPFDKPNAAANSLTDAEYENAIDVIDAILEATGNSVKLMVDCHWRLDMTRAVRFLEAAASRNLYWVECPMPEQAEYVPALKRLRSVAMSHGMRLAGVETGTGLADFMPWFRDGIYDVVMPDVKYTGGLAETMAIGRAAQSAGVLIAPHNPSGPVCHAASLQLAGASPSFMVLELQYGESDRFRDFVLGGSPVSRAGVAELPKAPGFGIELNRDALADFRITV